MPRTVAITHQTAHGCGDTEVAAQKYTKLTVQRSSLRGRKTISAEPHLLLNLKPLPVINSIFKPAGLNPASPGSSLNSHSNTHTNAECFVLRCVTSFLRQTIASTFKLSYYKLPTVGLAY